jgi:hypothetical protein
MSNAATRTARRDEILGELAELGLALARDAQAQAMAATDAKAKADLTLAFHRISRSVRQTLALDARFEREAKLAAREAAQAHARETLVRVQKKRSQLRKAVTDDIWTEYETEDAEGLLENIEAWVYDAAEDDSFLETPFEVLVARIRENLGLPANSGEVAEAEPDDDVHQSSG